MHLIHGSMVIPRDPAWARRRWTSVDDSLLRVFGPNADVHGGPPVVYVPARLSPDGRDCYLGILHTVEK